MGGFGYDQVMKLPPVVTIVALAAMLSGSHTFARGEGGGHMGGGERLGGDERISETDDDRIQRDGDDVQFESKDGDSGHVDVNREGDGDSDVNMGYDGKTGSATIDRDANGVTTVHATGSDGRSYDAAIVGPDGFRSGYIWRDGAYVPVDIQPLLTYSVPYGVFAGWSIVNQPEFIEYPCYATYPVETAVEVQLTALGYYEGPIDGLLASVSSAISAYQQANNLEVTGTLSSNLLEALKIPISQD